MDTTMISPLRSQVPRSEDRPAAQARRLTVLVVQKNEAVCELLGNILRQQGFQVLAATTFEAGLGAAAHSRVDLVIADYRCPGDPACRYLQVLCCRRRAVCGEFELVPKPFAVEGLLAAIGRLLAADETGIVSVRWLAGSGAQRRVTEPTLPLQLAG